MSKALKDKKIDELQKEIVLKKEELRKFRFGASHSRASKPSEGKMIKRDIARILTEMRARKLSDIK